MMRWVLVLECSHSLLADDPVLTGELDFCPACGHSYPVVESYRYRDEEL